MPSEDQSAVSKICLVVTPAPAALGQGAPQTECDLTIPVSIPASLLVDLSHLAIVEEVTRLCCPIQVRNNVVLGLRNCKSLNYVHSSYALKVMTGHMIGSSLNKGNKKSVKCLEDLCCFAK